MTNIGGRHVLSAIVLRLIDIQSRILSCNFALTTTQMYTIPCLTKRKCSREPNRSTLRNAACVDCDSENSLVSSQEIDRIIPDLGIQGSCCAMKGKREGKGGKPRQERPEENRATALR